MKTYTIDAENAIAVFPTAEAAATKTAPFETFASQKELAALAAKWPAERLVAIWNSLPGVKEVIQLLTLIVRPFRKQPIVSRGQEGECIMPSETSCRRENGAPGSIGARDLRVHQRNYRDDISGAPEQRPFGRLGTRQLDNNQQDCQENETEPQKRPLETRQREYHSKRPDGRICRWLPKQWRINGLQSLYPVDLIPTRFAVALGEPRYFSLAWKRGPD